MPVVGIGQNFLNISESTNISFKSVYNKFYENIKCLVVKQITKSLPIIKIVEKFPLILRSRNQHLTSQVRLIF